MLLCLRTAEKTVRFTFIIIKFHYYCKFLKMSLSAWISCVPMTWSWDFFRMNLSQLQLRKRLLRLYIDKNICPWVFNTYTVAGAPDVRIDRLPLYWPFSTFLQSPPSLSMCTICTAIESRLYNQGPFVHKVDNTATGFLDTYPLDPVDGAIQRRFDQPGPC